jgi:type II secretory ATPase GspE/PulE/Tfp pilus assembly ATPase PilB-like protein
MGRVFDIFSRRELTEDSRAESNSYGGRFIEYDPEMPVALEMFSELDKSALLDGCWVPLSWDENGIVVLVDDPADPEKQASIHTALKTKKIIFAIGIKEDIEAFINRSFRELESLDFLSKAMSGEGPLDVTKLVNFIIREAHTESASDIYFEWSESSGKNRVLFWMEGVYLEYMTVAETVAYDVVKRIKSMANLNVCDRELPKIGHLKFKSHDVPEIKMAVTTYPIDGLREDVVLKFLAA